MSFIAPGEIGTEGQGAAAIIAPGINLFPGKGMQPLVGKDRIDMPGEKYSGLFILSQRPGGF